MRILSIGIVRASDDSCNNAAGVVLGAALGARGLAVLVAVGIALLLATSSGIDLTPLWAQLGQSWATLTDALTQ